MKTNIYKAVSMALLLANGAIVQRAYLGNGNLYWLLLFTLPLLLLVITLYTSNKNKEYETQN